MPVTCYSVSFFASIYDLEPISGFTNDEDIMDEIFEIVNHVPEQHSDTRRWAASRTDGKGEVEDLAALKDKCQQRGGVAEEISTGKWSSPGCKFCTDG
jgi:hypothetical protein